MDILVTGGTVFASRYAAEYFAGKGNKVYVLNRGNNTQSESVIHIKGDRHDLGDTLKSYRFDAVLDITSYNADDVKLLHEALGEFGTYIFVSSSAVYPETLERPFKETQQCGANKIWGDYGTNKLAAEEYITANIKNGYIIRPPYLYGPMNNLYREAFVFECAEKDLPFYIPKEGKMPLQFFHIKDMCRFMEILIEKQPKERIYNVGNPETVDINKWVELCYKAAGKTPDIKYVDGSVPQRSYFPFYDYDYTLDVTKQSELMPDTTDLYEGLCQSYERYKTGKDKIVRKPLLDFIEKNFR